MKPGDILSGRYRLLRLLDVGGMGEVWAARNELTQRNFAIKFLLPELAERPDALERFIREAETAGKLRHPAIVDVYDVALSEEGRPYIVMELLAGESLETRLEREGTLPSLYAAAFVAQTAQALGLAHAAGVVHRDLTAANIFIARNPEGGSPIPKILDFGVSKTLGPDAGGKTANGAILGSPEYMSPEQARGAEGVDHRTDIWSLGVVLYECLAGTVPFREKNYNALMLAILTREHRPIREHAPNADAELCAVIEACLVKDREQRIQSAGELADRLTGIARRLSHDATDSGVMPRRRATDRLRASRDLRLFPRLGLSPTPVAVGVASALAGAVIGATAAAWTAATILGDRALPSAPETSGAVVLEEVEIFGPVETKSARSSAKVVVAGSTRSAAAQPIAVARVQGNRGDTARKSSR